VSEGDIEIVRRWYLSFSDETLFRELTHPQIEWAPLEHNHTVHLGLDDAARVVSEWSGPWSSYTGAIEDVFDAGEQGIVVTLHVTARGAASGVEVDLLAFHHFKTHEGKVIYLYEYADLADALAAAGPED
jgi:hypothetical protein